MSSPLTKHGNDSNSNKPRKVKPLNSMKTSSNLDSRTELADLIKRKSEISVSVANWTKYLHNIKFMQFLVVAQFAGDSGKFRTSDIRIWRFVFGGHPAVRKYHQRMGSIFDIQQKYKFKGRQKEPQVQRSRTIVFQVVDHIDGGGQRIGGAGRSKGRAKQRVGADEWGFQRQYHRGIAVDYGRR